VALTFHLLMFAAVVATLAALAICPVLGRRQRRRAVTVIAAVPVLLGAAAAVYIDRIGLEAIEVGFTALLITEIIAVVISPDPGRGVAGPGRD
jgi:hypothetical protein